MQNHPAPPKRKIEWKRAWNALQVLIDDPKRTEKVFEIAEALAGNSFERNFQRFAAEREGRRLLAERPSLLAALQDREALRALAPGSFGRAYADFMEKGNLTAEGLVEADVMAERPNPPEPVDPDREYYGDRIRDMHDLWHVLTGYGMDEAGEAANLAFTVGQIPTYGIVAIVITAGVIGPKDLRFTWQRYLLRAWRRGRRAAMLPAVPYEELLARPLDEVRRLLHIEPPEVAHPEGIVVANRDDLLGEPAAAASGTIH
jgi:ubiquinone biosynthesis protein COQ4